MKGWTNIDEVNRKHMLRSCIRKRIQAKKKKIKQDQDNICESILAMGQIQHSNYLYKKETPGNEERGTKNTTEDFDT
jgi:hypothetical protein